MADVPAWQARGDWFDVCRCNVPCPCSWAEPPDDDFCEGVLVWHIKEGNYGDVGLDGLNVVGLGTFKGTSGPARTQSRRWVCCWTSEPTIASVKPCR